jgi:hypothetical protein
MRVWLWLVLLACCTPLLAGCSGGGKVRAGSKVTGKVTFNGNPVGGAKVVFTDGNDTGATANGPMATTDEDGEFALVGVPPGSYKVVVYKFVPKKGARLPEEGEGFDIEQMEASGLGVHALPQKYSRPSTTTLVGVVGDGESVVELKLSGQADKVAQ